ncbi:tetratricopeptide TPR_2 [Enhygromyxa salina]|uniref:Tetratricopeptide TPR_2 n=1 Tax=Enhygromyxa salina TaxID=215803 RepID=A0A0C1ZJN6_9BACT|nr:tetratricopeptide TPR_2 [Enhygromyxa salina]
MFGVRWRCPVCCGRTVELCMIGPPPSAHACCLNCGAARPPASAEPQPCGECSVDHQQVLARVREHCELPPRTAKIRALRARGLYRLAFNAVAIQLQHNPDDPEALHTKAKLLVDVKRPEQAVPLLRQVMALGGPPADRPEVAIDLGVALAESGEHEAAILIYQAFLNDHPDHAGRCVVSSNLGGCLSALGRPAEAETYHRQAIAADPEHLGPRWNLFANLNKQGRHAEALSVLEQAMELAWLEAPDLENMQAYRSEVLIELGRLPDALAAIDASLVSNPDDPDRLFTRGRILHELGRLDQARAALLRVLELWPNSEASQRLLARVDRARNARFN